MLRIVTFFRFCLLVLVFSSPLILLAALMDWFVLLPVGIVAFWFFILSLRGERTVIRDHLAGEAEVRHALPETIKSAYQRHRLGRAKVVIYPDSYPGVLICRSFLGSGTILVSQGLATKVRDREMAELIRKAEQRIVSPQIPLATLSGILVQSFSGWIPPEWFRLATGEFVSGPKVESLSPLGAIKAFLILPIVRFLAWIGHLKQAKEEEFTTGLTVMRTGRTEFTDHIWMSPLCPGYGNLYFS